MGFASKHNHSGNQFTYKLESQDFKKLSELEEGKKYQIRGLFISHKGNYGDHPVAVGNDFFIDLPKHATQDVKDIIADESDCKAINDGLVGITPRPYEKNGKQYIGFDWVDLDDGFADA